MSISELIEKRTKVWDAAKAFVETKRDKDGILSEEDAKTYAEMEKRSRTSLQKSSVYRLWRQWSVNSPSPPALPSPASP